MTRLLHITTTDISLEVLLGPQLRAFRDAGYELHTASAPGPFVARLAADGIAHHALRHATRAVALGRDVAATAELYRLFCRLRPDIVEASSPWRPACARNPAPRYPGRSPGWSGGSRGCG